MIFSRINFKLFIRFFTFFYASATEAVLKLKCYNNIRFWAISVLTEIYIGYGTNVISVYWIHK